jgi:hypothetical protein
MIFILKINFRKLIYGFTSTCPPMNVPVNLSILKGKSANRSPHDIPNDPLQ